MKVEGFIFIYMKFENVILLTSLLIAGCAAYFSVYGIGLLFSGAAIAAMIMAASLELGKLVSTKFVFENWKKVNLLIKLYLTIAVFVLMAITSLGIFGYLTAAFQKSSLESELSNNKIVSLETQKISESKKTETIKSTIDNLYKLRSSQENRLNESMTNVLIARNPIAMQNLQNQINEQISDLNKQIELENEKVKNNETKISSIDEQIFKLKVENSQRKDITTFKFVADEFGTTVPKVAKWFIIVLITVFDPLAIVLLIAYNFKQKEITENLVLQPKEVKNTEQKTEIKSEIPVEKIEEIQNITENPIELTEEDLIEKEKERKAKIRARASGYFGRMFGR